MAALNSATSSNASRSERRRTTVTTLRPANAQESNGYEELPELQAVVIDRAFARRADSGPYEANGALAQGSAGTHNLPTAQASLLTPIRDERDPPTPTRPPCHLLPLDKSHIA